MAQLFSKNARKFFYFVQGCAGCHKSISTSNLTLGRGRATVFIFQQSHLCVVNILINLGTDLTLSQCPQSVRGPACPAASAELMPLINSLGMGLCIIFFLVAVLVLVGAFTAATEQKNRSLLCSGNTQLYGTSGLDPVDGEAAGVATANVPDDPRGDRPDVMELANGPGLPSTQDYPSEPDAFVDAVFEQNEAMGAVFQQSEVNETSSRSPGALATVAQAVEDQAVAAASPAPPVFEPLALDVLPQKYWQPVFSGCQSVFTDKRCDYSFPTPRLWVTDLDELQYARSLVQGRENMIEPLRARQALAQLQSVGVRARRDVYTQATPANDIASQSPCATLKAKSPEYVWR